MKKSISQILIACIILLFCISNLQAQFKVFAVTGIVEGSVDGNSWSQLKKNDELKESDRIRLHERSRVEIIDSQNLVYSYSGTEVVTVSDIIQQRKSVWDAMNEQSGNRRSIGGVERSGNREERCYLLYTDMESSDLYDGWTILIPGSVFYITICNDTNDDLIVNVYQELENKELIRCFREDLHIEKNTVVEMKEVLFGKQEKNNFIISYVKKE